MYLKHMRICLIFINDHCTIDFETLPSSTAMTPPHSGGGIIDTSTFEFHSHVEIKHNPNLV